MAFNYADSLATVLELLGEFGATGTLERRGATSTLQADGSAVAVGSGPPVPVRMVALAGARRFETSTNEGETRRDIASHLLAPVSPPPVSGDRIVFNGLALVIELVRTINPAGTPLCHFVTCTA